MPNPRDEFWYVMLQQVQQLNPDISALHLGRVSAWPFLMAASEEWLDASTIVMHPYMHVNTPRELFELRSRFLNRLHRLNVRCTYTWHANVLQFEPADVDIMSIVIGIHRIPVGWVVLKDDLSFVLQTVDDQRLNLIWTDIVSPAGREVVHFAPAAGAMLLEDPLAQTVNEIAFALSILTAQSPISMPTPGHPVRDWQTWHIGVDALEIVALGADTAAPLAIMSQVVAKIVDVWISRWQLAQAIIATWAETIPAVAPAAALLDDAIYFLQILQPHYPVGCAMRSLSEPEGALVAEVMRDARQTWKQVAQILEQAILRT